MYDELTEVDIRKMQEEIHYRTTVLRPKIMEDVKTARAFGDLSENYEYKAAKQEQRRCDSRLRYLKRMVATAKVISTDSPADVAGLFDTVTIRYPEDGDTETIRLVTTLRQDALKGLISKAVSYTHLDVYKRQSPRPANSPAPSCRASPTAWADRGA